MLASSTDEDWEWFGKENPYYGVVSFEEYRGRELPPEILERFFDGGRAHVQSLFDVIRDRIDPSFAPKNALDFGCGVGRVAIPLATRMERVTGLDISEGMLETGRKHAKAFGIDNISFRPSSELDQLPAEFDFVHSFIVFQHIPADRGIGITQKLVQLLKSGGVGVLHYTYARRQNTRWKDKFLYEAYQRIPFAYRLRKWLKPEPVMQMNEYPLTQLFAILQDHHCNHAYVRFTDHGCRGIIIMFQKEPDLGPSRHVLDGH